MDSFLRFFILIAFVSAIFIGLITLDFYKRHALIVPRTVIGDVHVGGLTKNKARDLLKERWNILTQTPISIAARGEVQTMTLQELGILFDDHSLFEALPVSNEYSNSMLLFQGLLGSRYYANVDISRTQLEHLIYKKFPAIPPSQNAFVKKGKQSLEIVPAQAGLKPEIEALAQALEKNINFFESTPLIVNFKERVPTVQDQDLAAHAEILSSVLPKTVTIIFEKQKWIVDFKEHPEWIRFERPDFIDRSPNKVTTPLPNFPFILYWDLISFNKYIDEIIAKTIDVQPEDVRIWQQEGEIFIEGKGTDGRVIDRDELHVRIAHVINAAEKKEIEIPMRTVTAKIDIDPMVQEMGIRELISIGYTRYDGSPANRQHNIATGVQKYNGLLIPQDGTFSFNENLGPVDADHGFKPELVIKPEGTVPEFGGGLCQVSTTLYRAALNGGMPIIDRAPHSYAVSYYAQVGGHGLDATIYPPTRDFKFYNDTDGPLLIQAYTEGTAAYFKFYGTKDDRQVTLEGPFISNHRSAPAQIIEVADSTLKPGQRKQVEKPHGGFDALWYRIIVKDDQTIKEEIKSRYRATQAKFLVGGALPVDSSSVEATVAQNPFE